MQQEYELLYEGFDILENSDLRVIADLTKYLLSV